MKICTKCSQSKSVQDFPARSASSDGLSSWCKECFSLHAREKYKNSEDERDRKTRNREKIIETNRVNLKNYLSDKSCLRCGNSDWRVLEFDHREPENKHSEIGSVLWRWGWARILVEISKCDILCANCHRIRTQEQFGYWRSN